MERATLALDPAQAVGALDRRVFGSFVEHMGRCVYTGIYEPDHPTADAEGFRGDVAELVRELGPTVLRYPGGNFVSTYRWEDGVGSRSERPTRLDLAWRSIETNQVGIDEFVPWARSVGAEPMMAVNLGTRGVQEAIDLVEYANHPGGTALSDLRRKNGTEQPHAIRLWCLGNEQDGPWQMGQKTAHEYGRVAAEAGKAMRMVDPDVELVAVGSSNSQMPTFGHWEREVLELTYDVVDHISMHAYYEELDGDRGSFLASAVDVDRFIDGVVATADHVGALKRSRKRLSIAFDEWNVWYQERFVGQSNLDWQYARPLIEDRYTAVDAVVVGDIMVSLLDHADRVAVACQAQLVNIIAPILTEPGGPAWRQAAFDPFALTARHTRGTVLRPELVCGSYSTAQYGDAPLVHATATLDEDSGEACLVVVHRGQDAPLALEVDVRALAPALGGEARVLAHYVLAVGDDDAAVNTPDRPDAVRARSLDVTTAQPDGGRTVIELPPVSWSLVRLGAGG